MADISDEKMGLVGPFFGAEIPSHGSFSVLFRAIIRPMECNAKTKVLMDALCHSEEKMPRDFNRQTRGI